MKFLVAGLIGFTLSTIASRIINEKALSTLTDEQKGALVSALASTRKRSVFILAGIILVFLMLAYFGTLDKQLGMYLYFGAFLIYTGIVTFSGLAKARKLDFPEAYMKSALLAGILRLVGFVILIFFMTLFLTERVGEDAINL